MKRKSLLASLVICILLISVFIPTICPAAEPAGDSTYSIANSQIWDVTGQYTYLADLYGQKGGKLSLSALSLSLDNKGKITGSGTGTATDSLANIAALQFQVTGKAKGKNGTTQIKRQMDF